MLERVALHQTRLRVPGVGLDPKGVAIGAKGLVLLGGLERLVAFLSLYASGGSLEDVLRSTSIELVRSPLGAREVTLTFSAEGSERLDRVAEVARLAGGYTFTGTSRHFVQYRDVDAPFGYDVTELLAGDARLALYHQSFTQTYELDRAVPLDKLLLRLELAPDPARRSVEGAAWLLAERGLGPALVGYLLRSGVEAEVGVATWPAASSFDDEPEQRYLFRAAALPKRMMPLLLGTPGIAVFAPVVEGVAVEVGHRHPIALGACPVFPARGLVLFRGHRQEPLVLPKLPAMGPVRSFARVELRRDGEVVALEGVGAALRGGVTLPLRMVPDTEAWRGVTATWITREELPLLRRMAYALGPETLRQTTIALTEEGAFVRHPLGIECVPVGTFFREVRRGLYVPAGYHPLPAVRPDVLFESLGSPAGQVVFLTREARVLAVEESAFVPLEQALLEAQGWAPLPAEELAPALDAAIPELVLGSPGLLPMRDVEGA